MSFSHADVSDQVKDISRIVGMSPGTKVADITNKRMFICCSGRNVANEVLANLKYNGYHIVQAAIGLKTDRYYVEARFNYPY